MNTVAWQVWRQRVRALTLVFLPLIGVVAAALMLWNQYVFAKDIALLLVFYAITLLGVTVGYHRMLTHQGFKAGPITKALILIAGCMAFEGAPITWASTHVKHHAHSDKEGDPHSPLDGFWHAHFGWIFAWWSFPDPKKYVPHLLRDKTIMFVNDYSLLWGFLSLFLPWLIGGWTGLVWGGAVRIFLFSHVGWSINSICHVFGRREFETADESRNNWLIGLLAFGEGWHNNHHAFPSSAVHGLRWWQFDLSAYLIWTLEKLGLIWDVKRVKKEVMMTSHERFERLQADLNDLRSRIWETITNAKVELERRRKQLPQYADAAAAYERALTQLNEIQAKLKYNAHFKKDTLLAYLHKVQRVLNSIHTGGQKMA